VKQLTAWCPVCGRQSLFQKPRINHVLHLILSIVTLGLWLFVWAFLGFVNSSRQPRCSTCGRELRAFGTFRGPPAQEQPPPPDEAGARAWVPEPKD
jgi:hypothetical protein